jgi:hypothetical protein
VTAAAAAARGRAQHGLTLVALGHHNAKARQSGESTIQLHRTCASILIGPAWQRPMAVQHHALPASIANTLNPPAEQSATLGPLQTSVALASLRPQSGLPARCGRRAANARARWAGV